MDPVSVCPRRLHPDPVCPERLDPDPVNIRPDPKSWGGEGIFKIKKACQGKAWCYLCVVDMVTKTK